MTTPIDRQISLPFAFGQGGGAVVTTTDLAKQIQDHVTSAVGTQLGERVMNPTYGTDLVPYLFDANDDTTLQEITQSITASLAANVPEVSLTDIVVVASDPTAGELTLQVSYSLTSNANAVNTVTTTIAVPVAD